jgi:predicted transposase YbfD/YdcC
MPAATPAFAEHFAGLPDPRVDRTKKHELLDIVAITICATIAGADSWEEVERFGRAKEAWLRRFLALPNGVPSHDTFNRVFAALDPARFGECAAAWLAAVCQATGLRHVAVDGKAVRGARRDTFSGRLHLVSAWACENRLVLGQQAVADGSHEIAAIPELLRVLDLQGALVTIDAAGCQVGIARQVTDQGGDYLLAVKGNQPGLRQACERALFAAIEADFAGTRHDACAAAEAGHGRREERYVTVIYDPPGLPEAWAGVRALVAVARERAVGGEASGELALYVSSYAGTARELGALARGHWGVENGLHWVLDVAFREDTNKTRSGNAGANLGLVRRLALSLLRQDPGRGSVKAKRLGAALDEAYLLQVLHGFTEN